MRHECSCPPARREMCDALGQRHAFGNRWFEISTDRATAEAEFKALGFKGRTKVQLEGTTKEKSVTTATVQFNTLEAHREDGEGGDATQGWVRATHYYPCNISEEDHGSYVSLRRNDRSTHYEDRRQKDALVLPNRAFVWQACAPRRGCRRTTAP